MSSLKLKSIIVMNSSNFLKKWFQGMINKYNGIGFKYGYCSESQVHYIAVYPYEKIETNEIYCKEENDCYEFLSKKYPQEMFIFGSENVNFKCLNNPEIFEYNHQESLSLC